jgi:hypothetical protein
MVDLAFELEVVVGEVVVVVVVVEPGFELLVRDRLLLVD